MRGGWWFAACGFASQQRLLARGGGACRLVVGCVCGAARRCDADKAPGCGVGLTRGRPRRVISTLVVRWRVRLDRRAVARAPPGCGGPCAGCVTP